MELRFVGIRQFRTHRAAEFENTNPFAREDERVCRFDEPSLRRRIANMLCDGRDTSEEDAGLRELTAPDEPEGFGNG